MLIYAVLVISFMNFAGLCLLFLYINRNWETHLEHKNQLNNIERGLSYILNDWRGMDE